LIRHKLRAFRLAPVRLRPKAAYTARNLAQYGSIMRLIHLAAFISIAASSAFAMVSPEIAPGFDELIGKGRAAMLASDPVRAESAYNLACPPDLVSAYPVAWLVTCENALASVDETRGNLSRAEQRYVHAVTVAEQAGPAYRPLYIARLIDLGEFYHHQRRFPEAETRHLKAVELARAFPDNTRLLPEALVRLGGLYADSPSPERGRAPLAEALAFSREHSGGLSGAELAHALSELGVIDMAAGRGAEAESDLRQAIALATAELGEAHPVTAAYQANLAFTLLAARQFAGAGILLRRAQAVVEARPSASGRELGMIYTGLSAVASAEGKLAIAEDYGKKAIGVLTRDEKPDTMAIAMAKVALAGVCLRIHDLAEADRILPEAVEAQRSLAAPNTLAASLQLLGQLREQQHNWQAAESLYREAIGIYERQTTRPASPLAAQLMLALADLLKKNGGSKAEVRALEARAHDMARTAPQKTPPA
jgi:tetratricopeptide (TPR) repeat protein